MNATAPQHPGVRYPPPLLFVAGLVVGWLLHRAFPLPSGGWSGTASRVLGWSAILAGGLLAVWAIASFRRARTSILPHRPASMLVLGGPYRHTRNPMYLALTLLYIGATVIIGTLWSFLLLPLVLVMLYRSVIRREERYLAAAFGAEYEAYRARVRRWI